jgi:hypothetical protein
MNEIADCSKVESKLSQAGLESKEIADFSKLYQARLYASADLAVTQE